MQSGKLRQRVIIEQAIVSQDEVGEETQTWVTVDEVWAAVEPLTGGERYTTQNAQLLAEADTLIRIRHRTGVTHKMRVTWESRTFGIQAVVNLKTRDRQIHLICKEKPGA